MKESRPFTPHEVECHTGQHGSLVRVCRKCGASWYLKLHGEEHEYAWQPVFELDQQGKLVDTDINVLYCYAGESKPVTQTQPAVQNSSEKPKGMCYCETCRVKRQHFDGDDRCFCMKCRGNRPHKTL